MKPRQNHKADICQLNVLLDRDARGLIAMSCLGDISESAATGATMHHSSRNCSGAHTIEKLDDNFAKTTTSLRVRRSGIKATQMRTTYPECYGS